MSTGGWTRTKKPKSVAPASSSLRVWEAECPKLKTGCNVDTRQGGAERNKNSAKKEGKSREWGGGKKKEKEGDCGGK